MTKVNTTTSYVKDQESTKISKGNRTVLTKQHINDLNPHSLIQAMVGIVGVQKAHNILEYYYELQKEIKNNENKFLP